ncbi:ARC6/PARC6 family protein [Microcoleus sp.]|uniref:ARC6/PARC6 family protein n=1 Tax=Microcoleus sp. TaxID=44472 RepID=UPI0035256E19
MNKLWLYLVLIIIGGCSAVSSNPNLNSVLAGSTCPEKPASTLDSKDVKAISLNTSGTITESNKNLDPSKSLGYTFEAQSGQKLSYKPTNNVCIWIFTQDITLVNHTAFPKSEEYAAALPKSGKYTIQVEAQKAIANFNLEMSLGTLQTSAIPAVRASPQTTSNNTPNSPSSNTNSSALTQQQASQVIQNWLDAKKRLFAPPYEEQLAANFTIGERYIKTTGAIKWLRDNNAYYDYKIAKVDSSNNLSVSSDQAQIDVNISEDLVLYVNNQVDSSVTTNGVKTTAYRFFLKLDAGTWKIENVENL